MGGVLSEGIEEAAIQGSKSGMEDAATQGTIHGLDGAAAHAASEDVIQNGIFNQWQETLHHLQSIAQHEPEHITYRSEPALPMEEPIVNKGGSGGSEVESQAPKPVEPEMDYEDLIGNFDEEMFNNPDNWGNIDPEMSEAELNAALEQVNTKMEAFKDELKIIDPSDQKAWENAIESGVDHYKEAYQTLADEAERLKNALPTAEYIEALNNIINSCKDAISYLKKMSRESYNGAVRKLKIALGIYIGLKAAPVVAESVVGVKRALDQLDDNEEPTTTTDGDTMQEDTVEPETKRMATENSLNKNA